MDTFLKTLLESLNRIEVKGKENIDILLGCMIAIENTIEQLNNPPTNEGEEEVNG